MAVTNPQAIDFAGELRAFAAHELSVYYKAKVLLNEWFSGVNNLFPNDAGEIVEDAGPSTGRPTMTGASVNNVMSRAVEIIDDMEASSNAKLNTLLAASRPRDFVG